MQCGVFFTVLSKNIMFTKFKLLVWRKYDSYWIIWKWTGSNLLWPFSSCSLKHFAQIFSKEIRAVSLLQLKVVVMHQSLCMCFIPKFWGCSKNCVIFYHRRGFGLSHCAGHSGLGNLEKQDTEGKLCGFLPVMQSCFGCWQKKSWHDFERWNMFP